MIIKYCFIREAFFINNSDFINMLDTENISKQSKRTHLCLCIEDKGNRFLVPLRNNLGEAVRKFGRIGYSIPSDKRKNAGLDFRYTLIVNDDKYIEWQNERRIPNAQYRAIEKNYNTIIHEFEIYIRGYIRAAKKGRVQKEPLYRVSSLQNFNKELGIQIKHGGH